MFNGLSEFCPPFYQVSSSRVSLLLVSRQMEPPKQGQIFLLEASMAILGWVLGVIRAAWGSYFLMRIANLGFHD